MFDSKMLMPIKTIEVMGNPDGRLYDAFNDHVYILSHQAPQVTVINAPDGAVVGTIDLAGIPGIRPATAKATSMSTSKTKPTQHRRCGRQNHDGDGALRPKQERRHLRRPRDGHEEQHSLRRIPHALQYGDPQRHRWKDYHNDSHQWRYRWRIIQPQYDGGVQLA
jgi:hypothetical protein